MLTDIINNFSDFLTFDRSIIPNIITLIVVVFLIILGFKMNYGSISAPIVLIALYTVSMTILTILGINSVFNIITLIGNLLYVGV